MIRFFPLVGLLTVTLIEVLISFYGPMYYVGYDKASVGWYLTLAFSLFAFGYTWGSASTGRARRADKADLNKIVIRILQVCMMLGLIGLAIELGITLATKGLSLNVAQAYNDLYQGYQRNTGEHSLQFLVDTFASPFVFISVIWGLYFFPKLNRSYKFGVIFLIAATIAVYTFGQGKQKQLGDLLIFFASLFLIRMFKAGKFNVRMFSITVGMMTAGMIGLMAVMSQRYSIRDIGLETANGFFNPNMQIDLNHPLFEYVSPGVGFPLAMFCLYLGGGFYGLSLSLAMPFKWTYMVGSSYSMSVIANQYFGFPFMYDDTYPARVGVKTMWDQTKWHTTFSWLASDLTFTGAAIFFGFVGFCYGRVWVECVQRSNPFAVLVFCLLNIGLAYIPANNQLMHAPGTLATLVIVSVLYLYYKAWFNGVKPTNEKNPSILSDTGAS